MGLLPFPFRLNLSLPLDEAAHWTDLTPPETSGTRCSHCNSNQHLLQSFPASKEHEAKERRRVKIVAGVPGNFQEKEALALLEAGAGELFVGYNPAFWQNRFGFEFSPNRRYRPFSQVSDIRVLSRLSELARSRGARVTLAFNEHFVTPKAWSLGRRLIADACSAGVSAVIVADPTFIPEVRDEFPDLSVHASGDAGIYNSSAAALALDGGASRVIFPRELGVAEMERIVADCSAPGREFEAFVMGEPCVYDGARCFTDHGYSFSCDFCNYHTVRRLLRRGDSESSVLEPPDRELESLDSVRSARGLGRCGLCAVKQFKEIGITHVKVPGRASNALTAVRLVNTMIQSGGGDSRLARALLAAPELCASGLFCYYSFPEREDG